MEKFLALLFFLFILIGIPALIFYINHRYRQRLKKAGLPPQGFFSSHMASKDLGKSLGTRHPLVSSFVMVLFGALIAFTGLPFFGLAFMLFFGVFFVGYLFGWAVRAPKETGDSVTISSIQLLQEAKALAEVNKNKVPKTFRFATYIVMAVAAVLAIIQLVTGPISLTDLWPSILFWFI